MNKLLSHIIFTLFIGINSCFSQYQFPLKSSDDKRYLTDQNNKPFPILGRTAWFIISQPESGYKHFLDNTLSYGYNSIEMAVITHWPMGNHAPFNGEGEVPFLKCLNGKNWNGNLNYKEINQEAPDLLTPNEKYWKFVDRFLEYCEQKGIIVFMFPAYLGYDGQEQGWMKELEANGADKTKAYGSWIANRYKERKNIVWMLLGDMGKFNNEQKLVEQALIKGLKSVRKQQSIHYTAESFSGENAADNSDFGNEMTLNGVYTWELKLPVAQRARKGYQHEPIMPAFLLEEPYDEEGPDGNNYNPNASQPVRRFQWWGWLGTIGGYISGNGYVWQFLDPIWRQHLDTQGAKDMGRLNQFINSIEWWMLSPSGLNGMKNLIVDGTPDSSSTYIAAAAAKDGSLLVAYIPPDHKGNITVDLSSLKHNVFAYWYDPTNGVYYFIQNIDSKKGETIKIFHSPGENSRKENDWVLLISNKEMH